MVSILNQPHRLSIESYKAKISPDWKETSKDSNVGESIVHQGHEYIIHSQKERYASLSIKRIVDIAGAVFLSVISVGIIPLLFQSVRDRFTGREVLILAKCEPFILDVIKENSNKDAKEGKIKTKLEKFIGLVPTIADNYNSEKTSAEQTVAHKHAKEFLKYLRKANIKVEFMSPPSTALPSVSDVTIQKNKLNPKIFSFRITYDVQKDIKKDGNSKEDVVIAYGVASQYNGCESQGKFAVQPGSANEMYKNDESQGPKAQLSFHPIQVEWINCAGNLGYNALSQVLDDDTKDLMMHGYLTPTKDKGEILIDQLKTKGHLIEFPCIGSKPQGGKKDVYQFLVAAPAFGDYADKTTVVKGKEQDEIQFLFALHSFRAQFNQCIELAKKHQKPVRFNPTAVGLGVFENNPQIVAKAFYRAALEYQQQFQKHQVEVIFQVHHKDFTKKGNATIMANALNLKEKK